MKKTIGNQNKIRQVKILEKYFKNIVKQKGKSDIRNKLTIIQNVLNSLIRKLCYIIQYILQRPWLYTTKVLNKR